MGRAPEEKDGGILPLHRREKRVEANRAFPVGELAG
jgi:hypothetical protein